MDRLLQLILGIGLLWAAYAVLARWDYTSDAKRAEEKERLKEAGLSAQYYFVPAGRLLVLTLLSGGFFVFYWSYKQWQAVRAGYKNTAGTPLNYSPLWRAVLTPVSFYQFAAILNRTCRYLRRPAAWPAWLWGTAFWTGAAAACIRDLGWGRLLGLAAFCAAPYTLQKHINGLPKELPRFRLKWAEMMCVPVGWLLWAAGCILVQKF